MKIPKPFVRLESHHEILPLLLFLFQELLSLSSDDLYFVILRYVSSINSSQLSTT